MLGLIPVHHLQIAAGLLAGVAIGIEVIFGSLCGLVFCDPIFPVSLG